MTGLGPYLSETFVPCIISQPSALVPMRFLNEILNNLLNKDLSYMGKRTGKYTKWSQDPFPRSQRRTMWSHTSSSIVPWKMAELMMSILRCRKLMTRFFAYMQHLPTVPTIGERRRAATDMRAGRSRRTI